MKPFLRLLILRGFIINSIILMLGSSVFSQNGQEADVWKTESASFRSKQASAVAWYHDYDVVFCKLDLHLERNTVYVEGNVTTQARALLPGLSVYRCELVPLLTVDSVFFNGMPATFSREGDTVIVTLTPQPLQGELFSIQVFYHGLPPTGGFFAGISTHVSTQWGNAVMWTLSQPYNASQWWPCKQDLADKYDSSWFFITTDTANKAGSNGLLTAVTPMPGGKHRYEWKERYPIDYYLISAAVADYQEYDLYAHPEGSTDSVLIQNYIYDAPGCLNYYKPDLGLTPYFIELYAHLFGPYPFAAEKYGHCQADLGGGMEHQTMGTLGAFNFHLNCHELTHQWFGDYVTCATWSDIWLNEGFATYGQYLALQYLTDQALADTFMVGVQHYVMSVPGGSVYIPENQTHDVNRIFDGRLSYNKGAAIIQALRGEINDDNLFFGVCKQYINTYGKSVATGLDFKHLAENITGINLDDFFRQWYFGEGFPIFDILYGQNADTLILSIGQHTSTEVTPLFKMHLELKIYTSAGDTLIRLFIDQVHKVYKVHLAHQVTGVKVDPHHWNIFWINSLNKMNDHQMDKQIVLFPNPWGNEIHYFLLTPDPGPFDAILYDIRGREAGKYRLNSWTGFIDTGDINAGIYFLKITNKTYTVISKLMKK